MSGWASSMVQLTTPIPFARCTHTQSKSSDRICPLCLLLSLQVITAGWCYQVCRIETTTVAVQRRNKSSYLLAKKWPKQLYHLFFSQHQGNYCILDSSVINVAENKEIKKRDPLVSCKPLEAEFIVLHLYEK